MNALLYKTSFLSILVVRDFGVCLLMAYLSYVHGGTLHCLNLNTYFAPLVSILVAFVILKSAKKNAR